MRTDGRTDVTKLIVAFRNFAKAPKNVFQATSRHIARTLTQNSVAIVQVLDSHSDVSHAEIHFHVLHLQERATLDAMRRGPEVHLGLHTLCNEQQFK